MNTAHHGNGSDSLAARLRLDLGVNLNHCYQCGKCAAGCPVAEDMDLTSCRTLRLLQQERPEQDLRVLKSEGIWLCLTCETCSSRCPQEVEVAKVMDYVRTKAIARNLAHPRAKDILAFHRAFLDSIRTTGRLYEIGLVADYKLRSRHWLKDVALAPKLYFRGKLPLLPHFIQGREAVRKIFQRTLGEVKR